MVIHLWDNGVYRPWYQEPMERLNLKYFVKRHGAEWIPEGLACSSDCTQRILASPSCKVLSWSHNPSKTNNWTLKYHSGSNVTFTSTPATHFSCYSFPQMSGIHQPTPNPQLLSLNKRKDHAGCWGKQAASQLLHLEQMYCLTAHCIVS